MGVVHKFQHIELNLLFFSQLKRPYTLGFFGYFGSCKILKTYCCIFFISILNKMSNECELKLYLLRITHVELKIGNRP